MVVTDRLEGTLGDAIRKYYKKFINMHQNSATKRFPEKLPKSFSLESAYDYINQNITWSSTKEGWLYFYTLNLRWVLGITYLCHEFEPQWEKCCIAALNRYLYFSSGLRGYKEKRYHKIQHIYERKIEKLKEIFGN